jgi:hypothetical protein
MCSALYRKCNTLVACPDNFTRTNDKAIPECVMKTCQVFGFGKQIETILEKYFVILVQKKGPFSLTRAHAVPACHLLTTTTTTMTMTMTMTTTMTATTKMIIFVVVNQ